MTARVALRPAPPGSTDREISQWWLASLVLLLIAAAIDPLMSWRSLAWPRWQALTAWAGVIAAAAIPRLAMLDRFPTVLDGDESAFMIRAVAFRSGDLPGWFSPGFYGSPNLYPVTQGLLTAVVGDGVAGHRALSALLGAVGVVAAWRLGRYVVGEPGAVLGALLLAAWPLHLHASRVALNNITDPTFLTLALLFAVRAVRFRQRLDAVACGMALAFGLYGFFGGRAFPGVILIVLPVLAVWWRIGVVATLRVLAWIVAGFVVTAMPLLAAFRRNPAEFGGHMDMVSTLSLSQLRADPVGTLGTYLPNLWEAARFPLATGTQGLYRHEAPYIGVPLASLLVVGAVVLAIRWWRTRDVAGAACLVVPWALLTAGIAITIPITGHRLLALTPIFALVAGSGLWWLATAVARLARTRRREWALAGAAGAVAAVGISHLTWMASEARQRETYGDHRSIAAYDLGWRLSRDDTRPAVLFAGAPFVWSQSYPSLTFLVDGRPMTDIEQPLTSPGDVPPLPQDALLVLVPERVGERCAVEAALPGVTVAEVRDRYGALLYLAYYRGGLPGWSTATSLAETTLHVTGASTCPAAGTPVMVRR